MRILVADDNEDLADMMAGLLAGAFDPPAEVDIAYDAAGALSLALIRGHGVAVLDIDMPMMSGTEAAMEIQRLLQERQPLLIAVSGNPSRNDHVEVRLAFDHIFFKPVDMDNVTALVRSASAPSPSTNW